MSETLGEVLNYITELLPNSLNTTTIVNLINAEQRKIWEHMTSTNWHEFNTVYSTNAGSSGGQVLYGLPTNVKFDQIIENGLFVATSTAVPTSTTVWNTYSYCGPDEDLEGYKYFEGPSNTFGIYPTPDNQYYAKLKYQEYFTAFASSDTSVQFNLDQDYIDIIKFRVMSRIAKSGNAPDVELANNYESDAVELEKKMKVKQYKDKAKTPRSRWTPQEWKWR